MFTLPAINDFDSGAPSSYGLGIIATNTLIGHEGANAGYNTIMVKGEGHYYAIFVS